METNLFKFPCPEGLSAKGKKARRIILDICKKYDLAYTGGCPPFYSPQEWRGRGERCGTESLLIVCHDGGDLEGIFSMYEAADFLTEEVNEALAKEGMFFAHCTGWYSAIYPI